MIRLAPFLGSAWSSPTIAISYLNHNLKAAMALTGSYNLITKILTLQDNIL